MKIRLPVYLLIAFLALAIQTTLLDGIRIFGIKPNILLILIIFTALLHGSAEGAIFGTFTGFAQDLASGLFFGQYALAGMYIGFIAGLINRRFFRENYIVVVVTVVIGTILYESFVCLFSVFIHNIMIPEYAGFDFIYAFRHIIITETLYNALAAIPLYMLMFRLATWLEGKLRRPGSIGHAG